MQRAKALYGAGSAFTLTRHQPPPPLGAPYPLRRLNQVNQFLQAYSQLEICLMLPPVEGPQPDNFKHDIIKFEITRELSIKDGHGAQVVLGNAHFPDASQTLVVKIFDPLFYPGPGPGPHPLMEMAHGIDFVEHADRDYSRESAAYSELDPLMGGREILKYHGSWTCNVPVDEKRCRPVRLIMLEHIASLSMLDLDPQNYRQDQRYEILAQLIEAAIKIRYHGVHHKDVSPRNVLVGAKDDGTQRVMIIDLAFSVVHRLACMPVMSDFIALPQSPFNHRMDDYWEWKNLGWDELSTEYMESRWGSAEFTPPPDTYLDMLRKSEVIARNRYGKEIPSPPQFALDLGLPPSDSKDSFPGSASRGKSCDEIWWLSFKNAAYFILPCIFCSRPPQSDDSISDAVSGSADDGW